MLVVVITSKKHLLYMWRPFLELLLLLLALSLPISILHISVALPTTFPQQSIGVRIDLRAEVNPSGIVTWRFTRCGGTAERRLVRVLRRRGGLALPQASLAPVRSIMLRIARQFSEYSGRDSRVVGEA